MTPPTKLVQMEWVYEVNQPVICKHSKQNKFLASRLDYPILIAENLAIREAIRVVTRKDLSYIIVKVDSQVAIYFIMGKIMCQDRILIW